MDLEKIYEERNELKTELISTKYDLENVIEKLFSYRQRFYELKPDKTEFDYDDHPYLDLSTMINLMVASYVGPAYHYNFYIDSFIRDVFWDDIKYDIPRDEWICGALRSTSYKIDVQALFLSIKMGLDRLVAFFSYYYRGVSTNTTFGRYKENGKARGFMSKVSELKSTDNLMSYIDESYHKWIKDAVSPRDTISHYNDLGIQYFHDSETMTQIPVHVNDRLMNIEDNSITKSFNVYHLKEYVDYWYDFFDKVICKLLKKELIVKVPRF